MLTEIQIRHPATGTGTAYEKLAYRDAVDYPAVSAGAFLRVSGDRIVQAGLVIGAVAGGPLTVSDAQKTLTDGDLDFEQSLEAAAAAAMNAAKAFIANNTVQPKEYRIQTVSVIAMRALGRALSRATAVEEK
jgi:CO/xanthine dehydrogenase FAD-binding subunit